MRPIDGDNLRGRVCERFLCAGPSSEEERRFAIVLGIIDSEPTITPPPNVPLTLEELREMDGEPVYVTSSIGEQPMWYIVDIEDRELKNPWDRITLEEWDEGYPYKAYRRRPEEGT